MSVELLDRLIKFGDDIVHDHRAPASESDGGPESPIGQPPLAWAPSVPGHLLARAFPSLGPERTDRDDVDAVRPPPAAPGGGEHGECRGIAVP